MRKKTERDYHALALKRGFKWLGTETINTKTPTPWECDKGHRWETGYTHIRNESGCPFCSGCARKTKDDYNSLAAKRGIKWIGDKALSNNRTKTVWKCSKEHQWRTSYNAIQRGSGCPICANRIPKTPIDYHILATSRRFKWLGPIVSRVTIKTTWQCEHGHQWEAQYNSIQQGSGCPYCAGNRQKTPLDYHALAKQCGFKWLGPEVPNNSTKTSWECDNQHQWEAPYARIQQNNGCPHCAGLAPKKIEDYYALAATRGFKWMDSEIPSNVMTKATWECEQGHQWESSYTNIRIGHNCPSCTLEKRSIQQKARWAAGIFDGVFQSPTSIEIETAKALDDLGIDHISQHRPDGYSRIFDEFIPAANILIETNGTYWHGPQNPQNQKRDIEKAAWAKEHDYQFVTIWEHEIREQGAEALIKERILPLLS